MQQALNRHSLMLPPKLSHPRRTCLCWRDFPLDVNSTATVHSDSVGDVRRNFDGYTMRHSLARALDFRCRRFHQRLRPKAPLEACSKKLRLRSIGWKRSRRRKPSRKNRRNWWVVFLSLLFLSGSMSPIGRTQVVTSQGVDSSYFPLRNENTVL